MLLKVFLICDILESGELFICEVFDIFKKIKVGARAGIEFPSLSKESRAVYQTQVIDIASVENQVVCIYIPTHKGRMINLAAESRLVGHDTFGLIIHATEGLLKYKASFEGNGEEGGIKFAKVKVLSKGEFYSYRSFFRYDLTMPIKYKVVKADEDISTRADDAPVLPFIPGIEDVQRAHNIMESHHEGEGTIFGLDSGDDNLLAALYGSPFGYDETPSNAELPSQSFDIEEYLGTILDVSVGGACVSVNKELDFDTIIKCDIKLPDNNVFLDIKLKIVRKIEHNPLTKMFKYGTQFVGISETDRESLIRYIFSEQRKALKV